MCAWLPGELSDTFHHHPPPLGTENGAATQARVRDSCVPGTSGALCAPERVYWAPPIMSCLTTPNCATLSLKPVADIKRSGWLFSGHRRSPQRSGTSRRDMIDLICCKGRVLAQAMYNRRMALGVPFTDVMLPAGCHCFREDHRTIANGISPSVCSKQRLHLSRKAHKTQHNPRESPRLWVLDPFPTGFRPSIRQASITAATSERLPRLIS